MENIAFFDIERLRNIFLHTTTSYKFFWMLAILDFAKRKKMEKAIPYDVLTGKDSIVINRLWRDYLEINATFLEGFVYQSLNVYLEKRNVKFTVAYSPFVVKEEKGGYALKGSVSVESTFATEPNQTKEGEEGTGSKTVNNTFNTYIHELRVGGDLTVLGDLITDNGKKINNVFFK